MNESGPIFRQSFLVSNIVTLNLISMVFSVVDCLIVQVSCSTDTFVFSPIKNRHGERESNHRNKVVLDFIKIEQYEQTITRFHKSTSMIGVEIIAAFLRRMLTPSAWKWNCNFEQKKLLKPWETLHSSGAQSSQIYQQRLPYWLQCKEMQFMWNLVWRKKAPLAKASENLLTPTPPPASLLGSTWETAIIILCLSSLRWLSLKIIARHSGVQILGCTVQDSWTKVVCIKNAPSFPQTRFWLLCWNNF